MCRKYCVECGFETPSYQIKEKGCQNCGSKNAMVDIEKRKNGKNGNDNKNVKNDRHTMLSKSRSK